MNPISQIKEILPQTEVALPPTAIVVIVSKFNRCRLCATLITFTVPEKRYDEPVRCCLQDVFHLMKRIKVKKAHPFYSPYVIALSDAFFIWDSSDLNKVRGVLLCPGCHGEHFVRWLIACENVVKTLYIGRFSAGIIFFGVFVGEYLCQVFSGQGSSQCATISQSYWITTVRLRVHHIICTLPHFQAFRCSTKNATKI